MYARSRHSTSDFDRSLRQQQIISSLREKVSNLGYFKNRKQIVELYDIFTKYVETDLALTDMVKL
jgi:anionic cell wall polymer biosynthesis LytR-Cps2A-Psr (LCP) family protein